MKAFSELFALYSSQIHFAEHNVAKSTKSHHSSPIVPLNSFHFIHTTMQSIRNIILTTFSWHHNQNGNLCYLHFKDIIANVYKICQCLLTKIVVTKKWSKSNNIFVLMAKEHPSKCINEDATHANAFSFGNVTVCLK